MTTTLPLADDIARPESLGYGARLGNLLVRLATGPGQGVRVRMAELQTPRFQTEAHPEEILVSFGDVYSLADATGGEGLFNRFRSRGTDSDATRFWASEDVDVSPAEEGRPEEVRLLSVMSLVDALAVDPLRIAVAGTALWATNGQQVRTTADITAANPVFVNQSPHAGEGATHVTDVATLGNVPYAALGIRGIHRNAGAWAHWSDVNAVRIWEALDRIVASTGVSLYEAAAGAGSVLLYTLATGEEWNDVIGAGAAGRAIVAAASNGNLYAFTIDDAGDLGVTAQVPMEGEEPVALASRAELIWIATQNGTTARLWEATLTGSLNLTGLQLVREWDGEVTELRATRDRLLIGVKETGQPARVWRLELATSGLSKAQQLGDGSVHRIAVAGETVLAAVAGQGIYRNDDALSTTGHLISAMADFFRAGDKSWVTGWADVEVPPDTRIELYYTTDREALSDPDHGSWTKLKTYFGDSEAVEVGLGGVLSRAIAGMLKLYGDGVVTPRVRAMSFRSYPTGADIIIELPVDVGDQLERPGRRRITTPGWGAQVHAAIRDLEGDAIECEIFRTGDLVLGLVENVATPVPTITELGSVTVMSLVTVRGRRVTEVEDLGEGGWLGGFPFGEMPLGGVEVA